jgi:hypothetical protein
LSAFRCLSLRRPRKSAFRLARAQGDAGVAGYAPAITCGNAAIGPISTRAFRAKCGQRLSSHSPTALFRLIPSGILTSQHAWVKATYEEFGLKEQRRTRDGKHMSGCLLRTWKTGEGPEMNMEFPLGKQPKSPGRNRIFRQLSSWVHDSRSLRRRQSKEIERTADANAGMFGRVQVDFRFRASGSWTCADWSERAPAPETSPCVSGFSVPVTPLRTVLSRIRFKPVM